MHRLCEAYHQLPVTGGLFEQDPYVLYGLMGVLSAIDAKQKLEEQRQENQIQNNKGKR